VGSVAYKLELPATSLIHPVFHVSQLNKVLHVSFTPSPTLPGGLSELQVPNKVIQRRLVSCRLRLVQQGLIQWSNSPPSLATWEDIEALKQHFHDAPAWGQAGSYQGGVVMTLTPTVMAATEDKSKRIKEMGQPASSRAWWPSVKVTGPEWVN
jgi:hypothetical protein